MATTFIYVLSCSRGEWEDKRCETEKNSIWFLSEFLSVVLLESLKENPFTKLELGYISGLLSLIKEVFHGKCYGNSLLSLDKW